MEYWWGISNYHLMIYGLLGLCYLAPLIIFYCSSTIIADNVYDKIAAKKVLGNAVGGAVLVLIVMIVMGFLL